MQILLTNDDGIYAPGLRAIYEELLTIGEVQVVAPAAEQSGVGLSITYLHPLMVQEEFRNDGDGEEHFGWAIHGSPADCVKLGVLEFCSKRPDLVVSGINAGSNVGINVLYSGTVAGAIEGAFFGITSVAVSLSTDEHPDYRRTARMAVDLIRQLLDQNPKTGSLWNINFPESTFNPPLGVKLVSLGVRRHVDVVEKRVDPRGRPYYWSGMDPLEDHQLEPETDVKELADGYVTITPLHFDVTSRRTMLDFADVSWQLRTE